MLPFPPKTGRVSDVPSNSSQSWHATSLSLRRRCFTRHVPKAKSKSLEMIFWAYISTPAEYLFFFCSQNGLKSSTVFLEP